MTHSHRIGALGSMMFATLILCEASRAVAQEQHISNVAIDSRNAGEGGMAFEVQKESPADTDLLVVPIPLANPTLGTGLTLAGVMFYNPNDSNQPWITGIGGVRTSNESWGVAAFHSMALAHDRFHVMALAGYADINVNFYGIGPLAGKRNISVDLNERGAMGIVQGQYRIADHTYAGVRYQFMDVNSRIGPSDANFPDLEVPEHELNSRTSAVGPSITYDTRDSSLNPGRGAYITAVGMFNIRALDSDFSHDKWQIAANGYIPIRRGSTLALRAAICGVSDGGPFYDLCLYGQGGDLRGYEAGRYRDHASWATQVEWRQHLGGKFGAVFFGGIGGIAPKLHRLDDGKILPSAGMGVRYLASKEAGVNLRLDFAMGHDSHAVYFGIGEAF